MKRKSSKQVKDTNYNKRIKVQDNNRLSSSSKWPVLHLYYIRVSTLREYLLSELERIGASKARRRIITYYGAAIEHEEDVAKLLDEVVVGSSVSKKDIDNPEQGQIELSIFSQQLSDSTGSVTGRLKTASTVLSQSEIIDFTIWSLFRRHSTAYKPPHMLCHGFVCSKKINPNHVGSVNPTSIPGILSQSPNQYAQRLKTAPWTALPPLLGKGKERLLINLFLDCGLFIPLTSGDGDANFLQISGTPMSDLCLTSSNSKNACNGATLNRGDPEVPGTVHENVKRGLNDIRFVRHRMLYGRPIASNRVSVEFGLRYVHVLNRCRDTTSRHETVHIMKYMFPRQFSLHNVFTSDVDKANTSQPFRDYTLREVDIKRASLQDGKSASQVPKRLRGSCEDLVSRLRRRHTRCSYTSLMNHYCPVESRALEAKAQALESSMISLASPSAQVAAFCRSVVARVFPKSFWGSDGHNQAKIMRCIDRFMALRRYESMTLHDVLQDIKIVEILWLAPPSQPAGHKLALSDLAKRKEMFSELVYYLFDSFLIPLISSNFHVTESSSNRNQLFYFRHDIWKKLAEPTLTRMKSTMFEEADQVALQRLLARRGLGTSQIRLLPKDIGLRPIINLRRRVLTSVNGRTVLSRSINQILTPAFNVLNYEKSMFPQRLGASLFSVDEIFPRLRQFQDRLQGSAHAGKPLYFAKLDVQACFDTIPHRRLISLLSELLTSEEYILTRYAEAKLLNGGKAQSGITPKPIWKYSGRARAAGTEQSFMNFVEAEASGNRGRVFVDSVVESRENQEKLLLLLREHIERNVVQIGKKLYRQKVGIPQGSIVSSLLCNFLYAELEREVLGFLKNGQHLLLRLIDDFLLISTDQQVAARFVKIMHAGIPRYGLSIKREKTRVNFDVEVDGIAVTKLPLVADFPYCGNAINTVDLHIKKDEARRERNNIAMAITVEGSKTPGQNFFRKTLNMLKVHMHAMHLCTSHNGLDVVLSNLYSAFFDTAERCIRYIQSLPNEKKPSESLIIRTIEGLVDVAFGLMQRKKVTAASSTIRYQCSVTRTQTKWLAARAFSQTFQVRQTRFIGLLLWLDRQSAEAEQALIG